MRIFLIRHGESEANADRNVWKNVPDHDIALSEKGEGQAQIAGKALNKFFKENPAKPTMQNEVAQQLFGSIMNFAGQKGFDTNVFKARLWNSPYRRARETATIIGGLIGEYVKDTREDVLLCEQQYGLFDGLTDKEQEDLFPIENKCFQRQKEANGKFWARYPMGESAFDTACRLRQFFGTINRDEEKGIHDHIIVCHGTILRLFTMMWLHYKYEWFEKEKGPGNCAIRLIDNNGHDGYKDRGYIFESAK